MTFKFLSHAAVSGVLLALATTGPAHAYLDPGTGTFILQILAAGAVGALFYVRRIGAAIKGFFGGGDTTEAADAKKDDKPE